MKRREILEEAIRCVCSDREEQYGTPEDNFSLIGEFWESYLRKKRVGQSGDISILPEDVAAMMVLFKAARIATGTFKADSWIDAAGYCACGGEIGSES